MARRLLEVNVQVQEGGDKVLGGMRAQGTAQIVGSLDFFRVCACVMFCLSSLFFFLSFF